MAAAADMPDIKSGRLMQLSELASWAPNDVHGNAVRVLGRYKTLFNLIFIAAVIRFHIYSNRNKTPSFNTIQHQSKAD